MTEELLAEERKYFRAGYFAACRGETLESVMNHVDQEIAEEAKTIAKSHQEFATLSAAARAEMGALKPDIESNRDAWAGIVKSARELDSLLFGSVRTRRLGYSILAFAAVAAMFLALKISPPSFGDWAGVAKQLLMVIGAIAGATAFLQILPSNLRQRAAVSTPIPWVVIVGTATLVFAGNLRPEYRLAIAAGQVMVAGCAAEACLAARRAVVTHSRNFDQNLLTAQRRLDSLNETLDQLSREATRLPSEMTDLALASAARRRRVKLAIARGYYSSKRQGRT